MILLSVSARTLARCESGSTWVSGSSSSSSVTSTESDNAKYKLISTLSDFYDRELVGTIGWAKQIPGKRNQSTTIVIIIYQEFRTDCIFSGFSELSLNDQMRLLQSSWSEILTLSLVFRSLPTSGRLNFAADFSLTEAEARECGLWEFFYHVSRDLKMRFDILQPLTLPSSPK